MDGFLPVKVIVPLDAYRQLNAEAARRGIEVGELISIRLAPPDEKPKSRMGRPSAYTTEAGEEIAADRRFGRSFNDIGRSLGINHSTAKAWLAKYQNEVREQNMRDRAGRKTA